MQNLINRVKLFLAPDGAGSGSADNGSQQAGNAELLSNAFGAGAEGAKPETKPDEGKKDAGGGTGNEPSKNKLAPWAEQLPPEMRDNPETAGKLAKFGKIGEMAKAYLELEGKAAGVVIPGKDAKPEDVAQFWEKAGKPKTANDYSFAKDAESNGATFAQAAFAANLTEAQGAAMLKSLQDIGAANQKAYLEKLQVKQKEAAIALEKEYGSKYKENMEFLTRGLNAAGPNVAKLLAGAGLSGDQEIIKAFIAYGKMTAESGASRGGEAGAAIKSIMDGGSPEFKT